MGRTWLKDWLNYVDRNKVTLFPLQLANCDRLEKHKAVYIFDEVGSGKTISAGLMALHYLYNNPRTKVLVITTSQLADRGKDGTALEPFKKMWLDKLPFHRLSYENRIEVINHDYRNIKKHNKFQYRYTKNGCSRYVNNWDLVIIDEAHVFLNRDPEHPTRRYKKLVGGRGSSGRILAQKVVFLTATPIRRNLIDLKAYPEIAFRITHPCHAQYYWPCYTCFDDIDQYGDARSVLAPSSKQWPVLPEDLICATFDVSRPFTRYFKDTVCALDPDTSKESSPKRMLAKTWMCTQENRQKTVLQNINALYEEAPERNRFVIFVRWVKENSIDPGCSADELEAYFIEHGFAKWQEGSQEKSVEVVTGANHKSLSQYRDPDPSGLPTVLIVNYQIGEQGVNLPGYNHVINYHIPASPSSLEQRFGRIDRLDSTQKEISVYFPLLEYNFDSSTINFYIAMSTYLRQQLPVLPARNAILTKEILDTYEKYNNDMMQLARKIESICEEWKTDAPWAKIRKYLDDLNGTDEVLQDTLTQEEREVAAFILGIDRPISIDENESAYIERLKKVCKKRIEEILDMTVSQERIESMREILGSENSDEVGNMIFYYSDRIAADISLEEIGRNLNKISPIGPGGCAELIRNSCNYKKYESEIKQTDRAIAPV